MIFPNVYQINEAYAAVEELREHINEYGAMSVADVYHFMKRDNPNMELPSPTYRDNIVGWDHRDVHTITLHFVQGGAQIMFSEPHTLAFRV